MEKPNKIILLNKGNVLLNSDENQLPNSTKNYKFEPNESFEFEKYFATDINDEFVQESGLRPIEIRKSYQLLSREDYAAVAKASELLHWNRTMRFCSKCGSTLLRNGSISKKCNKCNTEYFPQLSPAIIVLIRKNEQALLVHARNFKRPFFGLVAGFVETGESLEQCVIREVREETSLEITNVKYFGSQSWPFPSQLMIGFTADYLSGEVQFADGELTEGGFFSRDNLPEIPTPPSIARKLIESWLDE